MDARRTAPFTPAEVATLNEYQQSGVWHPFTCGNALCGRELIATEAEWVCPGCSYTQDWAYTWMADGSWCDQRTVLDREG
jgi:hypothetical protein